MVPYVRLVLLLCAVVVALQPAAAQKALQYNLEQFKEKYVRPGKPNDDPKAQPDHEDYDPFHLPMPTLKTESISAEDAFNAMDTDKDGFIKGPEFKGVRETGYFHLPELPDLKTFGMKKELFIKRHGHQVVSGTAEETFDFHDKDKNGALNKKEYDHAKSHLRAEV